MNQDNSTLISVALITHNHEKFIESSLRSVLEQSYTNIEIIISDDASTDNTINIARKYAQAYPNKIKLLTSPKNTGAASNWFKCVSNCSGEYIIVLAGDDEFLPGIISEQATVMQKDANIAICYSDAIVFDVSSQKNLYCLSDKTPAKSGGIDVALSDSIYYSPSTMFRAKFMPKKNIFHSVRHGADLAFYKELMIRSAPNGRIHYLPKVLYKYQKHNSNITVTQSEYRKEHITCIKILQKKYPEYKTMLEPAIYDFCCVAFFKNLLKYEFKEALFFLSLGIKASKGNPFKFLRATTWGMSFFIKNFFKPK